MKILNREYKNFLFVFIFIGNVFSWCREVFMVIKVFFIWFRLSDCIVVNLLLNVI